MALDAASSSSSAPFSPNKYDVFISFRGEDTRTNFTRHLHDAFCRKQIQTYLDYRLNKGDEISSALMQAIEDSYVSVVIFSENYASSRWCLDELIQILHCRKVQGQVIIPVFYKVDPSHVRHQIGTYQKAFEEHERDLKHQHKVPNWKAALNAVANLAGWDSCTFRDDAELIQTIVEDVLRKLDHMSPPPELKGLVGIHNNCAHVELLLRRVQTIGIWGMGGIGKTTIAQVIFSKYSSQYEGCCFLESIRENSGKHGNRLHDLRCELLSKLLAVENLHRGTSMDSNFVRCRLKRMKVFIVLDDVDTLEQLECLALDGEHHCFGPGSRIIITTRDKHVLSKGVDEIYEVKKLEFQESLHLFNLNAFNQNLVIMGYKELTKRAVVYAKGIPLALKVLGSFLHGKSKDEWNSALKKIEKIPHEGIQKVLRLSYDALNNEEKQIFLDIACFLKGMPREDVISLLDSYGFYGAIGIRTLQDKALISVDVGMRVTMHDLIQQMGCEVVREESINEPERRSRLYDFEEIYDVLNNNKGTKKVEGMILDISQVRDVCLSANTFKKMPNIRFLKIYSTFYYRSSSVHLPEGLELLPNSIRYLEWHSYPLKSLPSTFCPQKLVELHMPGSNVKKLWNGVQDLGNLKKIDLSGSRQVMELPDLSKALSLTEHCKRLCSLPKLPPSICYLYADDCTSLETVMTMTYRPLNGGREYISFGNCPKLNEESLQNIIEYAHSAMVRSAYAFQLNRTESIWPRGFLPAKICLPGSRVPKWFRYQTTHGSITIELPPISYFVGFFCCLVLPSGFTGKCAIRLECECYFGDNVVGSFTCDYLRRMWIDDHVYIWDHVRDCDKMSKEIERRRGNDQFITNLRLSLRLALEMPRFNPSLTDMTLKEFGVCPIYVSESECQGLASKMELNKNNKSPRDVDEEETLTQFKKL